MDDTQLWDQQEGETGGAFAAFVIYRDMHPALRSVAKVAEADPRQRAVGTLADTAVRNKWTQRAHAYDAHADALRQARCEDIRAAHDRVTLDAVSKTWEKVMTQIEQMDPARITPQYLPNFFNALVKASRTTTGASVPTDGPDKPFEQVIAELNKEVAGT